MIITVGACVSRPQPRPGPARGAAQDGSEQYNVGVMTPLDLGRMRHLEVTGCSRGTEVDLDRRSPSSSAVLWQGQRIKADRPAIQGWRGLPVASEGSPDSNADCRTWGSGRQSSTSEQELERQSRPHQVRSRPGSDAVATWELPAAATQEVNVEIELGSRLAVDGGREPRHPRLDLADQGSVGSRVEIRQTCTYARVLGRLQLVGLRGPHRPAPAT